MVTSHHVALFHLWCPTTHFQEIVWCPATHFQEILGLPTINKKVKKKWLTYIQKATRVPGDVTVRWRIFVLISTSPKPIRNRTTQKRPTISLQFFLFESDLIDRTHKSPDINLLQSCHSNTQSVVGGTAYVVCYGSVHRVSRKYKLCTSSASYHECYYHLQKTGLQKLSPTAWE